MANIQKLTTLHTIAEMNRRSLVVFIKHFWHILEPDTRYLHNWHIDAIADHLLAVTDRRINDLVINIAPRSMKSILVTVCWPTWEWLSNPSLRYLTASYAQGLSIRDNVKARTIINSPEYQKILAALGCNWKLRDDQDTKTKFENTKTGFRFASSVGGSVTGEGANRLLCDDPLKADDVFSETKLENANRWWGSTFANRKNQSDSATVLVMQRLHENDVAGYLLGTGHYELLSIGMEYNQKTFSFGRWDDRKPTSIGWMDPRTDDGQLMWPEKVNENDIAKLKASMGALFESQYNQNPVPLGNRKFERGNFVIIDNLDGMRFDYVYAYWDLASTQNGGCWTCRVLMTRDIESNKFIVLDCIYGQWSESPREKIIKDTSRNDMNYCVNVLKTDNYIVAFELQPGGAGIDDKNSRIENLAEFNVEADRATGDKIVRAGPFAVQVGSGNVYVMRGPWNNDYFDELEKFPNGRYKDMVDASSGAYNKVASCQSWGVI